MSLTELRPAVQALPRRDKFLLVQELIAELAQEEDVHLMEKSAWLLHDAYDAAAIMQQMLEQEKARTT